MRKVSLTTNKANKQKVRFRSNKHSYKQHKLTTIEEKKQIESEIEKKTQKSNKNCWVSLVDMIC